MEFIASVVGFGATHLEFLWTYILPFLVVLTVLVFVHELGHYSVARRCGVRVEVFSIGFGPEIYGWNDSRGTRWKFSAIPFGGYVKMFGEMKTPTPEEAEAAHARPEDLAVSFHTKPLLQRAAIVFAGPFANLFFAVIVLAVLFVAIGQPFTPSDVGEIVRGSAAERAGLQRGDVIRWIDGKKIERFEDVQRIVQLSPGRTLVITVQRGESEMSLSAVPDTTDMTDRFGNKQTIGRLGVSRSGTDMVLVHHDPATATWRAVIETINLIDNIFDALWQIVRGTRTVKELGGPIRIAQMSGDVAQIGIVSTVMFMVLLSINLGLINLFPIPMLDGGHLLFYAIEALRGRPLGERAQEYGFRIGLALVSTLMLLATWNDLVQLHVFDFLVQLFT